MAVPGYIRAHGQGVYLSLKVQPRASKNEVGEQIGQELKVKVTAPPVDAAANQAVIDLLADTLEVSRSSIQIARGHTSRHKTVYVDGITPETAAARLVVNR